MSAFFGPAGNADSFVAAGYKSSADASKYIASFGLNAYEYQCGNGVVIKYNGAKKIGDRARENGISLSIHAPYFISMSGEDDTKRLGSLRYFMETAAVARIMGATRIVYHPGGLGRQSRETAVGRSVETLKYVLHELDMAGYGDIALCPEVMGKINQVGTLEEILFMCSLDERLIPCIDFGHLNARTYGSLNSSEAFEAVFNKMEQALGVERTSHFHAHFSKIQYSKGGEVRHLTFQDSEYGPEFSLLAPILVRRGYEPTIISESAGTQAEDAATMMIMYQKDPLKHTTATRCCYIIEQMEATMSEKVILDRIYTPPVGDLGIIGMRGCEELTEKINNYLYEGRKALFEQGFTPHSENFSDYCKRDYRVDYKCSRFGTGEGKALINQTVRGMDIFIIADVFNYGVHYNMYGVEHAMSPDDHFQDLKRIIGAIEGKARRINIIMPMLYSGRQHRRTYRESLDCAIMLQELTSLGVDNIITFDAHDARVQNAIPLHGFEDFKTAYQMIKAIVHAVSDIGLQKEETMIVSPDEGGMHRCIYYSEVLGVPLGMFYKRRDYSIVVNGRNPILSHEFLGDSVEGRDVIIVDDMIASGDSVLDIMRQLKARHARRIFVCTSFGLFTAGLESFDKAYEEGLFDRIFTTNLVYRTPELKERGWYCEVDMSKYISYIINTLNHDHSLSKLLDPQERIKNLMDKVRMNG